MRSSDRFALHLPFSHCRIKMMEACLDLEPRINGASIPLDVRSSLPLTRTLIPAAPLAGGRRLRANRHDVQCHRFIKHRCHAIVNSPRVKRSEPQDGCNYRLQPPPRLQLRLATSPCQMSYHLRTYALPGPQSHHLVHYCLCLLLMMVELVNDQSTLNVSPQIGRSHLVSESSVS